MKCACCQYFVPFLESRKRVGIVFENRENDNETHPGICDRKNTWNVSPDCVGCRWWKPKQLQLIPKEEMENE